MMRRVSSRQRLVSWDSFDAVQRELDDTSSKNDDDDEVSSFEDGAGGVVLLGDVNSSSYSQQPRGRIVDDSDDHDSPMMFEEARVVGDDAESSSTKLLVSSGAQQPVFKRKRTLRPRKNKASSSSTAISTELESATRQPTPPPSASSTLGATGAVSDTQGASLPCLESQTDDVMVHLSTFLDLAGVRSLSQVNRRFRAVLLRGEQDYLWNVQAQRLWANLPMADKEISWSTRRNGEGEPSPHDLSKLEHLALAQHPVPTMVDSSIFTPCRWSRSLRNRTVVVRGSLQKELVVVATDDPSRPAVQFLGVPGRGDRSIRSDAPLPSPNRLVPQPPRPSWRPSFFRRPVEPPSPVILGDASPTRALAAATATTTPPPTCSKWKPFVVPTLVREEHGDLVWDVSPRLLSYFEVEILPPTAASASANDDRAARTVGGPSRRTVGRTASNNIFADDDDDGDDEVDDFAPRLFRHSKECVAVGIATEQFSLHTRMPGWDPHSWGYHGDDAGLFHGAGSMVRSYGRSYGCGDTVGCGVDWVREQVFFTLNGESMGDAFDFRIAAADIYQNKKKLYPVVGIDTTSLVRVNLTGPFMFDVQRILSDQAPSVSATLRQMKK